MEKIKIVKKISKICLFLICGLLFIFFFPGQGEGRQEGKITVVDEGFFYEIEKQGKTVKEILSNAKIKLNPKDIVFPNLNEEVFSGGRIFIKRAVPLTLNLYGKKIKIFTQKRKVKEVLKEYKITFKEDDLINHFFNENIFPGMEIKIWKKPKPKLKPLIKTSRKRVLKKTGKALFGKASWYSFIPGNFCASRIFPKGTLLLVTNLENGRKIIVKVNDYGPFTGRIIDLEKTAFSKLAPLKKGIISVKIERVKQISNLPP